MSEPADAPAPRASLGPLATKIAQALLAFGLSAAPFLLNNLLQGAGTYAYLLKPPYIYEYVCVAVLLAFSPQIFMLAYRLLRFGTVTAFLGVYSLQRRRWVQGSAVFALLLLVVVATANLIQGGLFYGYTAIREFVSHEKIYRARLIEQATREVVTEGREAAAATVRRVLLLYPNDPTNKHMRDWVLRLDGALATSALLRERSTMFRQDGDRLWAIRFARASEGIWPDNNPVTAVLQQDKSDFDGVADKLQAFYASCAATGQLQSPGLEALSFLARHPVVIQDEFDHATTSEANARLRAELCIHLGETPEESTTQLKTRLFDPQAEEDDF